MIRSFQLIPKDFLEGDLLLMISLSYLSFFLSPPSLPLSFFPSPPLSSPLSLFPLLWTLGIVFSCPNNPSPQYAWLALFQVPFEEAKEGMGREKVQGDFGLLWAKSPSST